MKNTPSQESALPIGSSLPSDAELPEDLYQEFLRTRDMEDRAGHPTLEMIAICRRMTPQQRLATGMRMTSEALRQIRKAVLAEHPDWSKAQLCAEVGRRMEVLCA
jgi:hypothetical protein